MWLDVPYVHQEKDACGSASLSMLLQYWRAKNAAVSASRADPAEIQRQLFVPAAHGIYASAIEKYLRDSGFQVFAFRGEWSDLRKQLAKGRPLLVSLKPSGGAPLHYVLVVGIDWQNGALFLNDPARSKLFRVQRDEFAKEWQRAGNWTLLAVPQPPS
jgi:ABC-type bacteriocin/lantibiotic exporter with double-glycine peptidase domain